MGIPEDPTKVVLVLLESQWTDGRGRKKKKTGEKGGRNQGAYWSSSLIKQDWVSVLGLHSDCTSQRLVWAFADRDDSNAWVLQEPGDDGAFISLHQHVLAKSLQIQAQRRENECVGRARLPMDCGIHGCKIDYQCSLYRLKEKKMKLSFSQLFNTDTQQTHSKHTPEVANIEPGLSLF